MVQPAYRSSSAATSVPASFSSGDFLFCHALYKCGKKVGLFVPFFADAGDVLHSIFAAQLLFGLVGLSLFGYPVCDVHFVLCRINVAVDNFSGIVCDDGCKGGLCLSGCVLGVLGIYHNSHSQLVFSAVTGFGSGVLA